MGLLDGKVAIITGAGGGLGRTHALAFAAEGAKVVVNDLGGSKDGTGAGTAMADTVVNEIKEAGGEAVANYASVADAEGAQSILQSALDAFGRIDILVNNAGILRDRTLLKMEDSEYDLVMTVHSRGTYLCTKAAGMYFREAGHGGAIINTTSYSGLVGNFGQSNYAMAKAGIAGFTRTIAQEFGRMGVTVNAVAPMAKTRMTEGIAAVPDEITPEQISPFVVYLATEAAGDVTGRIFGLHGPQIFEYRMIMTDGATKKDGLWTLDEIAESMEQIGELPHEKAAPAGGGGGASPAEKCAALFGAMPKGFKADKAGAWAVTLHFEVKGTGDYTLTVGDGQCTYAEGKQGTANCTLLIDNADTILGMAMGEMKPEAAFMSGKLKADSMGELMKFAQYFDMEAAAASVQDILTDTGGGDAPQSPEDKLQMVFDNMGIGFLPEKAGAWAACIHFHITGSGEWTVNVTDGAVSSEKGLQGDSTLAITFESSDILLGMVEGTMKPEQAFMAGKMKADNMGELMKFGQFFDMKKGAEAAQSMAGGSAPAAPAKPKVEGLNPDAVGKLYKGKATFYRPEQLAAYAAATEDTNNLYKGDDAIAPVMFAVNPVMDPVIQCVMDPMSNVDLLRLVHGEQDMYFHQSLKPWDLVYPVAYFDSFVDKSSGQLMTVRQELLRDGEVAIEVKSAYFIRGEKKPGDAPKPKAAPKEPETHDYLFADDQLVAADQPIRYGHASGDTNAIHMDDETAKAAGHPGIILHGLCTMAFACKSIVGGYLDGDVTRLARLRARFSKPVLPGWTLTTRAWLIDEDNGTITLGYETINQDGVPVITNGLAEVRR
jgi:NAD(P)-dependent dehydrogenase (short-subunit alcohol dehydrogenase family)/acyl dehydratase/putative sterol carrier protein